MDILDFFWTFYLNHLSPLLGYFLTVGIQVFVKWTGFQERHKIADIWEDDIYVITDQLHKDIPVYTI